MAGGEGRRMNYQDKGLTPFQHSHFVDIVLEVLQQQCHAVAINANRNIAQYQTRQVAVYPDQAPWLGHGPLSGVCSSVSYFPESVELIQVLPCDMPWINSEVINNLYQQLTQSTNSKTPIQAVFACTAEQDFPIVFQFRRTLLEHMQDFILTQPKFGVKHWLASVNALPVQFEDASWFVNINDHDTLQSLQSRHSIVRHLE